MNKKVIIALSVVLVLAIGGIVWVLCTADEPKLPTVNNDVESQEEVKNDGEEITDEGVLPNIISKTGIIKEVGKNKVIINGENGKEITIYVTEKTEIYGPDGAPRVFEDLTIGTDITIDIDGEDYTNEDTKFEAMIIYISGK